MTAAGFEPTDLTVAAGDTVVFKNNDSRTRWPASNLHPTHLLCPGFDSLQPVRPGGEYTHAFTRAEECPMHDHLIPSIRGRITVTE